MKAIYKGKTIELDDEEIKGRDEFDNNDDDNLEKTMKININEIGNNHE